MKITSKQRTAIYGKSAEDEWAERKKRASMRGRKTYHYKGFKIHVKKHSSGLKGEAPAYQVWIGKRWIATSDSERGGVNHAKFIIRTNEKALNAGKGWR
jgi:hypothetical protein